MIRWMLLFLLPIVGCGQPRSRESLTLATTTSARDSGLLDVLIPRFEQESGIKVRVIAVGTGQALTLARRGDADVLLTHAPDAEKQFIADGYGIKRHQLMHNDFVLVGPSSSEKELKQSSIANALTHVAQSKTRFVTRGDESGTHLKEKMLWRKVGIAPEGEWYISTGSGMAQALRVANEKRACVLTDRGTFLAHRRHLDLVILSQGDPMLRNDYSVIVVSPKKHTHLRAESASRFARFLLSKEAQDIIRDFGKEKYGEPLFHPDAASDP